MPVLTRVRDIRALKPDEARKGYPVHLHAVVTYYGGQGWELFIQDSTEGIYVDATSQEWPVREGDLIDLEGSVAPGDFAPELTNVRIRVLERSILPPAPRVTLESLLTGKEDSQWIEIEGVVRSVTQNNGRTRLDVETGAGRVQGELPTADARLPGLVDGRILMRGACGTIFNKKRQLTGVQLFVPGMSQITVVEPPLKDPFSIPIRPINAILQFTPQGSSSHRIRVRGVVTLQTSGQRLFIKDETEGLQVRTSQKLPLRLGDQVDAVGFPSVGDYTPVLEEAIYRVISAGPAPKPEKITAAQALQGDFDSELVQIEAELKDQLIRSGERTLILSEGNVVFEARWDAVEADTRWSALKSNSLVSLTGICSVQVDEGRVPRSFRILLRDPDELRVLRAPSWWTIGRALALLGIIAAVSLVALGWVVVLRRRVQRQTEVIRQKLEREAALEKRFQYVSRATNDAVWDLDLNDQSIWWNEGIQTLFGYSAADVKPNLNWWSENLHPDDRERVNSSLDQAISEGKEKWSDQYRFRRADRTYAFVFDRGYVIRNESGRPTRMIGAMMDVSPQKEAEEALQRAKLAAESANRAKSDFLANMSHEIRTPMNGILGTTELLLDTELAAEQREYLGMVKTSADSLLTVINDILDFSKIEAGKLDLDNVEFDLRRSLGETAKSFALRAHSKGLEIACDFLPDVPDRVVGDPVRLRQVVVNLVGNAIKFTERGEVVLRVEVASREGSDVTLHFTVRDSGIGVPADKLASIFSAFSQADGSTTRKYGGTGLGLTISSRLVAMMQGRIWVESEVGRGSEFHFEARLGVGTEDARPDQPELTDLTGVPVLVVDDNETNRRILLATLQSWGMRAAAAESAPSALAALREAEAVGKPYSLVLTDACMPGMDGFALSEKIRQSGRLAGATIMMLTSGGGLGDAARCRALGVAAHLTKPVIQSELRAAILTALCAPNRALLEPGPAVDHLDVAHARSLRVLLAEDNTVNQVILTRLLAKRGHSVTLARDGLECLDALRTGFFDLLLLDVQMPEMDGFEVVRRIREMEASSGNHLVVFALTAHVMSGDRERCLQVGMDDYLTKPIHAQNLYGAIERHFAARQRQEIIAGG